MFAISSLDELLVILEIACTELVISSTVLAIKVVNNADKKRPYGCWAHKQ